MVTYLKRGKEGEAFNIQPIRGAIMETYVRLFAATFFFFGAQLAILAADPPADNAPKAGAAEGAVKAGPAKAEFERIHEEFKAVQADLTNLQMEYRKASPGDRPTIEKKWKESRQKGEELQDKFIQAAEKAFAEAPDADKELTGLLWKVFAYEAGHDDFENAARLGKLLIDNGSKPNDRGFALAGVAAVSVGDFKSAANFFKQATAAGAFKNPPDEKDTEMQNAFHFSQVLPELEKNWDKEQKIREAEAKADDLPRVRIKTDKGEMIVELFENEAPNTVANFISLVEKKFYDGLAFHRVLQGFMAQGGDPQGNGSGGPGYNIPCECYQPNHRDHFRGTLSMAHAGRDTGGSQFFLCFIPTKQLDGKHTAFGRVISGFDVLSKIQRRDPEDPNAGDPDKIVEMTVVRKRNHEYKVKKTN
jgi:cyclophilin family peptidyl-prolyl cis-trans isomerase